MINVMPAAPGSAGMNRLIVSIKRAGLIPRSLYAEHVVQGPDELLNPEGLFDVSALGALQEQLCVVAQYVTGDKEYF